MKYYETEINIEDEKNALLDYFNNNWDIIIPEKNLTETITSILQAGIKVGIVNTEEKYEKHAKNYNTIVDLMKERKDNLYEISFTYSFSKDEKQNIYSEITRLSDKLIKNGLNGKPKGYDQLKLDENKIFTSKTNYSGLETHEDLLPYNNSFIDMMDIQNIKINDFNRDNNPINMMIKAVYNQGITLGILAVEKTLGNPQEAYIHLDTLN